MRKSNKPFLIKTLAKSRPAGRKRTRSALAGFALLAMFLALKPCFSRGLIVQINGSHFRPTDQAFKDVYGNAAVYGGEVSIPLSKNLSLWAGGSYCSQEGKLTLSGEETRLKIMPLYAGLKCQFSGPAVRPYFAVGAAYFRYEETNPLGALKEGDWGAVARAGVSFRPFHPLILDVHAGYSYCKIKPADLEADLGGLSAGVGLGIEF